MSISAFISSTLVEIAESEFPMWIKNYVPAICKLMREELPKDSLTFDIKKLVTLIVRSSF